MLNSIELGKNKVPGNSPLLGFGLWSSNTLTIILESAVFVLGLSFYLRQTVSKNMKGKIMLWILVSLLIFFHVYSLYAPPPPTVTALAWSAQFQWVFVLLAYWADANRRERMLSE